jgi:hypothetical protein
MSSYAMYCLDQAAECARRAKLARSREVAAYFRSLALRWLTFAEQGRSWASKQTRKGVAGCARRSTARPQDLSDPRGTERRAFSAHSSQR